MLKMGRSRSKKPGKSRVQLGLWDNVDQLTGKNPFKKKKMPDSLNSGAGWNALFNKLNWNWQTNRFPGNQKRIIRDAFMELRSYDSPIVNVVRARRLIARIVESSKEHSGISDWIDGDIFKDEFLVRCAELFIKKTFEIICRSELLDASDLAEVEISTDMINGEFREIMRKLLDA